MLPLPQRENGFDPVREMNDFTAARVQSAALDLVTAMFQEYVIERFNNRDKEKDQDGAGEKGRGGRIGHPGKAARYQGKPARGRERKDCDDESVGGDEEETSK